MAWAFLPNTLLGFIVGVLGLATGGGVQKSGKIIEFWGGVIVPFLRYFPIVNGAAAMTLGHVVIGLDKYNLDRARDHELVHVAQYERWGPLFLPAYFGCSLFLWLRGKEAYYNNPFEMEAYGITK